MREDLARLASLIMEIMENEPSDEELDYDETKIEVYDAIHNLRMTLEDAGYIDEEGAVEYDDEEEYE